MVDTWCCVVHAGIRIHLLLRGGYVLLRGEYVMLRGDYVMLRGAYRGGVTIVQKGKIYKL